MDFQYWAQQAKFAADALKDGSSTYWKFREAETMDVTKLEQPLRDQLLLAQQVLRLRNEGTELPLTHEERDALMRTFERAERAYKKLAKAH
jgi:hypothetical protein